METEMATTPPEAEGAPSGPPVGDRREIFGWMMYAWAFHGFITTVATVLLGPYLTLLAQRAVGDNGRIFGPVAFITAKSFFPYCVSVSVFLQLFLLPVLGAIADYSSLKKRLLASPAPAGPGPPASRSSWAEGWTSGWADCSSSSPTSAWGPRASSTTPSF